MVLDPQLLTEIYECVVVGLLSIIKDEDPRDSKVANDAFRDSGLRFYLDLFGEVINPYD